MSLPSKVLIAFGVSYAFSPYLEILIGIVAVFFGWWLAAKLTEEWRYASVRREIKKMDTLKRASVPVQYGQLRRIK